MAWVRLVAMEEADADSAARFRTSLIHARPEAHALRSLLNGLSPGDHDAWFDRALGIDTLPDDGPDLPRGCTPYLPCPVETLLRMIEQAKVHSGDVFVDVGSGLGRAALLAHLLTDAAAIGIEIQPHLARASRDLAMRLGLSRFSVVQGDAARLTGLVTVGSVFFLYCPFSGERLAKVVDDLESIARTRTIRICTVHLPLPPRSWLAPIAQPASDLAVYRSTLTASPRPAALPCLNR